MKLGTTDELGGLVVTIVIIVAQVVIMGFSHNLGITTYTAKDRQFVIYLFHSLFTTVGCRYD